MSVGTRQVAHRRRLSNKEIDLRDYAYGAAAVFSGGANVAMQLSLLPVAYGVMESKVENGRVDKHPFKRGRTTLTYLGVAIFGTDEERDLFREAVNSVHRHVRSDADSPVKYNAFDRDLQLWVAACLYWGFVDVYQQMAGAMTDEELDVLYDEGSRLATTLQVPREMWPADRGALQRYFEDGLASAAFDENSKAFLVSLLRFEMLPKILRPLTFFLSFMNIGFLPRQLRDALGLSWSPRQQRNFERVNCVTGWTYRHLPRLLKVFPINFYLWDMRRRIKAGKPLV